jgi:hypothetical protein
MRYARHCRQATLFKVLLSLHPTSAPSIVHSTRSSNTCCGRTHETAAQASQSVIGMSAAHKTHLILPILPLEAPPDRKQAPNCCWACAEYVPAHVSGCHSSDHPQLPWSTFIASYCVTTLPDCRTGSSEHKIPRPPRRTAAMMAALLFSSGRFNRPAATLGSWAI